MPGESKSHNKLVVSWQTSSEFRTDLNIGFNWERCSILSDHCQRSFPLNLHDSLFFFTLINKLSSNPRIARYEIINFIIFSNKKTLNMFNLDIGSVSCWFFGFIFLKYNYHSKFIFILVCSVKWLRFCFFDYKPKTITIYLVSCYMNFRQFWCWTNRFML